MAITNLGRIGFVLRGNWVAGTYNNLDVVMHNSSVWGCGVVSTTEEPGVGADWVQLMTSAAVPAGSSTVLDTGGYFDGAEVESVLQEIGAALAGPAQASTALGGTGAQDGANTWAKLATFNPPATADYTEHWAFKLLGKAGGSSGIMEFFVCYDSSAGSIDTNNTRIEIVSNGRVISIADDSLRLVAAATAAGTSIELWLNKSIANQGYELFEIANNSSGTITYETNSPWTATAPTGAVQIDSSRIGTPGTFIALPEPVNLFNGTPTDRVWQTTSSGFPEASAVVLNFSSTRSTTGGSGVWVEGFLKKTDGIGSSTLDYAAFYDSIQIFGGTMDLFVEGVANGAVVAVDSLGQFDWYTREGVSGPASYASRIANISIVGYYLR